MRERRSLIILAGGKSRRMGRDKASLPAGGRSLLEHVADRLRPVVDEVIVAAGAGRPVAGPWQWVPDERPGLGPLGGIFSGLHAASAPYAMVVGCDQPDVEPSLGELLFAAAARRDAAVPLLSAGPEGTCAVYRSAIAPIIAAQLAADRSIRGLLTRLDVRYIGEAELRAADPDLRSFRNLNTATEYEAWLRLAER